jgi:hypothetical protein
MGREINLTGPQDVTVVTREEVAISTDVVYIDYIMDYPTYAVAVLSFGHPLGYTRKLTLWSGEEYANIGQWTDQQAMDRVKELLNVT